MTFMFLDDLRAAPDDGNAWVMVRSFDEFVVFVETFGIPDVISFDHDLGVHPKTGMDAARWLVEQDLDGIHKFPEGFQFFVHSANPCGAANIRGLMGNYLEFIGKND